MNLPRLRQGSRQEKTISVFGGYNHNLRIPDGTFFEMTNMTSDHFPVLSSRESRSLYVMDPPVDAIVNSHGLAMVRGDRFSLPDGQLINMELTPGDKTLIPMGAYVIILPDKKWVNVAACLEDPETEEGWGMIEACWNSQGREVTVVACLADGTELTGDQYAVEKPAEPVDGQLWRDTTVYPPVLKRWDGDPGLWTQEESAYVSVRGAGIGKDFRVGDSVRISLTNTEEVEFPETSLIVGRQEDVLVLKGLVHENPLTLTGEMEIGRKMPDMDLVIECGNRLWGCKYGITDKGFLNEIYCSRLGDFRNWDSFQGISTDSYVVSVGADGMFTGAVSYQGRPIFFKEQCAIEIFGAYPAQYQLEITACEGVQQGCHKSLAVVNNVLYYKARQGICAFDGSVPVRLENVFGDVLYSQAVAGGWRDKYWISMQQKGRWSLFVYDTVRGLWHREDALRAKDFALCGHSFYCLTDQRDILLDLAPMPGGEEGEVSWMVQTGPMGMTDARAKYLSALFLRLWVARGGTVTISCRYDENAGWDHLYTLRGTGIRSFEVPIRPKRCDNLALKLEGTGQARIYSLTKVWEEGGDAL